VYIEPFLGGGAVMRLKRPARLNIGVDLDRDPLAVFSDGARIAILEDERSRSAIPRHAGNGEGDVFRLIHGDAFDFLRRFPFRGDELVYCDPPYMPEVRSHRRIYRCELVARDHMALLSILCRLPCMVMLSGYWSPLYAERLKDWHAIRYDTMSRGGPRTEWLWSNFAEPVALHDYRYLGEGFRERERIKRKKLRWVNRLARMPLLERRALAAAIAETDSDVDHRRKRRGAPGSLAVSGVAAAG
jgi:DNA adenine methylase